MQGLLCACSVIVIPGEQERLELRRQVHPVADREMEQFLRQHRGHSLPGGTIP